MKVGYMDMTQRRKFIVHNRTSVEREANPHFFYNEGIVRLRVCSKRIIVINK